MIVQQKTGCEQDTTGVQGPRLYRDEKKQKRTVLIMLGYAMSLGIPGLAEASLGGGRRKTVYGRKKTEGKDQNGTGEIIFQ